MSDLPLALDALALLATIPASVFRRPSHGPGALVQLATTASVADALAALSDADVTGAPVYEDEREAVRAVGRAREGREGGGGLCSCESSLPSVL